MVKIFLDTANVNEIKESVEYGVIDGVTTNPSLIAKENKGFLPLIRKLSRLCPVRFQWKLQPRILMV